VKLGLVSGMKNGSDSRAKLDPSGRQQMHDAITRVASGLGAVRSSFTNGVSVHRMPDSITLATAHRVMAVCNDQDQRCFIGTIDGTIVISINFNHSLAPQCDPSASNNKKKRRRDPHEEAADLTVQRVRGGSRGPALSDGLLDSARKAVYRVLSSVKGANGEAAIESYGLSFKGSQEAGTEGSLASAAHAGHTRPRLILSARIAPGVAVSVKTLLAALGGKCSQDGMFTVQSGSTLASGFDLPLTEPAMAAVTHGQRAVSLFATVSE
jgi:hypothetical protein